MNKNNLISSKRKFSNASSYGIIIILLWLAFSGILYLDRSTILIGSFFIIGGYYAFLCHKANNCIEEAERVIYKYEEELAFYRENKDKPLINITPENNH